MKRCWVLVALLAAGLLSLSALAQEEGGQRRQRRAGRDTARRGAMGRRDRGAFVSLNVAGLSAVDDLSEDQQRQIAELRKAALAKVQEIQKQMEDDVKKVLTPAQLQKLEEARKRVAMRGPGGVTMTEAQKAVMDEARAAAAKVEDRQARMKIIREAMEKVRASYTDEQKKQAEAARNRFRRGTRRPREGGGAGG
jgi:hypothetical protein